MQSGDALHDLAVVLRYCENARVEGNLIELPFSDGSSISAPLRHQDSKSVRYFDNTDAAGHLIMGAMTSSGTLIQQWPDLATLSEDAATLSLF